MHFKPFSTNVLEPKRMMPGIWGESAALGVFDILPTGFKVWINWCTT